MRRCWLRILAPAHEFHTAIKSLHAIGSDRQRQHRSECLRVSPRLFSDFGYGYLVASRKRTTHAAKLLLVAH